MVFMKESVTEFSGKLPLEKILQEKTTHISTTTFIAEDIAHWRSVGYNLPTLINARVAASA